MKYLSLYITAVVAIILDQISKWTILAKFEDFERVNIIPHFFDLTLVYNTGAAFSFAFNVADSFICVGVALLIIDGLKQGKKNRAA